MAGPKETTPEPGQMALFDTPAPDHVAELWERERRQTKVGRPRKGEERPKGGGSGTDRGGGGRGGRTDAGEGVAGARMKDATVTAQSERGPAPVRERLRQESDLVRPSWTLEDVVGQRVARADVAAALKRALGRIRDPERWTPLHLAGSRREHDEQVCWWVRWPRPESSSAIRWSAQGAVIAVTPDESVQHLAVYALGSVWTVEQRRGHAATVQYLEERIAAVEGIAAEYVTPADIWAAVARLPTGGQEREGQHG